MRVLVAIGVFGIALFALPGSTLVLAQQDVRPGQSQPGVIVPQQTPALVTSTNLTLRRTYMFREEVFTPVPAGFVNILGPFTVRCPGKTTCTFELQAGGNAIGTTAANNRWGLAPRIDGGTWFWFIGTLRTDGYYVAGYQNTFQAGLAPGEHTVHLDIYTDFGGALGLRQLNVRVYNP
ncbi:MAG TPA: hypothetical protein VGR25_13740 [bacterium]|nr:hypothetical protein [bacterium]